MLHTQGKIWDSRSRPCIAKPIGAKSATGSDFCHGRRIDFPAGAARALGVPMGAGQILVSFLSIAFLTRLVHGPTTTLHALHAKNMYMWELWVNLYILK